MLSFRLGQMKLRAEKQNYWTPKESNYSCKFMRPIPNPDRQNEIESDIKIYAIYNEILIEESVSRLIKM